MPSRLFFCLAIAILAGNCLRSAADIYEPPNDYYLNEDDEPLGTGDTLKGELRTIVSTMTGINYGNARYSAPYTDAAPDAGNVLLIYNRASVPATWDEGDTWNREHIWPVSRLGVSAPSNTTTNIATDQVNLRPANPSINTSRSNTPFGLDTATGAFGYRGSYYYPGDADAGDVARAQFYMATRYSTLTLTDGAPAGTQMGDLSSLVAYHFRDVPDTFERRRNHAIYGLAGEDSPALPNPYAQQNRNPYVDHPEYVWSVFVDQANDSALTLQGGISIPTSPGGTTLNVDLGRRLVGYNVVATQSVTLNKAGVDGTYYSVTTAGATSSVTGQFNAFPVGATGSRSIAVGVANDSLASPAGLLSGTVTIDNLDVTTAGGAGNGANDGNDVISTSLRVLDHANASFAAASDVNSLSYDFGTITVGSAAPTFEFNLSNLSATAGFTAGLDLDLIVGSGATSVLTTNLAPFGGGSTLAAASSRSFAATLGTATAGSFSASYTLGFSDENLPGAAAVGGLTLLLSGIVQPAAADFNGDGNIDGDDFLTWQRGLGNSNAAPGQGDANGDHVVNDQDLAIWRAQFVGASIVAASPVPEPSAILTLLTAIGLLLLSPHSRRARTTRDAGVCCGPAAVGTGGHWRN